MIIEGRAVVVPGDDVNTDVLYPGPYLNIDDPAKMKAYLFDGLVSGDYAVGTDWMERLRSEKNARTESPRMVEGEELFELIRVGSISCAVGIVGRDRTGRRLTGVST